MPAGPASALDKSESTVDHSDPWKEDGNIVLSAQEKYFRVHRSVLSAHSEVFKDMFDCPHSDEAEKEFIELCPVIRLHDSATEVQVMLNALYDRSYPLPYYEKMPFSFVAAFLHLGEKYGISALVKEAKAKLCCVIEPTSVSAFSKLYAHWRLFPAITNTDPYNFQIMNLLEEMGLKAPLPLAMLYCIIFCPLTNVIEGYKFNGSLCSLSPANLGSFICMKDMLENLRVQLVKTLYTPPSCDQWNCTHNARRAWLEEVIAAPPFDFWKCEWDRQFCEACRGHLKGRRQAAMTKAWNQLPTAFGLDSWAEVRKSGDFPPLMGRAQ